MREQGYECRIYAFLDDRFFASKILRGHFSILDVVFAFFKALKQLFLFRNTDLIIVHGEFFPFFPPIFETLLVKIGRNLLFEFDDAVFVPYEDHRSRIVRLLLKNKIRSIIRNACGVIAGNEYLASYARENNSNVRIIPTVVDLDRYTRIKEFSRKDTFTIGWIGSPSTSPYLELVEPVLKEFFRTRKGTFFVIGAARQYAPAGIPCVIRAWSEAEEIDQLLEFDVGIMPVPQTRWTQGKCGFKIVQYMACGIPAVASPVGKNSDLVVNGTNGFLANSPEAWLTALIALHDSPDLCRRMGLQGRLLVEKHYSLQCMKESYIQFINACVNRHRSAQQAKQTRNGIQE